MTIGSHGGAGNHADLVMDSNLPKLGARRGENPVQ